MGDAQQQWQDFRTEREAELQQEYGWLALQGFHWVPESPTMFDDVPGVWSSDGDHAYVDAEAADELLVDGTPVEGRSQMTVAETSRVSWLRWNDVDIELLRRGGRFAIRLRAKTSPHRESFTGVPTYDYDPAWVIRGQFHPYPEGRRVEVATYRPELRQSLTAAGEVEFTLNGAPQRLVVTSIKSGLSVEFHDPTNDTETAAWRQLKFDDPAADGTVTLDFNRTINMWFAFSDHVTCPRPAEGNSLTVPVLAGEQKYARLS